MDIDVQISIDQTELDLLKTGIAVDIDETLSWTAGFWVRQMVHLFGNPENLTPEEMLEKYQYVQNVPYWKGNEVSHWIAHHIKSDRLQQNLPEVKDAHLVNELSKKIPISAYITTRPRHVLHGTRKWLRSHGFPTAPIFIRPDEIAHQDSYIWKAALLNALYPKVKGIVDDNQQIVSELGPDYQGTVFLFGHDPVAEGSLEVSAGNVVICKDWHDVIRKVEELFQ